MAVFEIETSRGRLQVEAPDMESAIRALNSPAPTRLTPDDRRSPIPNELIDAGRQIAGQEPAEQSYGGAITTWLEHAISDLPIVGPYIQAGSDYLATEGAGLVTGEDPAKMREDLRARREQRTQDYPMSSMSGGLGGNIAAFGGAGLIPGVARGIGMEGGTLLSRVLRSAVSTGGINAADTMSRGGSAEETAGSAGIGTVLGAAIPAVGAGINAVTRTVGGRVAPVVGAIRDAGAEAERRVGTAVRRDIAANPGSVMSEADEVVAREAGIPVINADRGGETTRALARSVANQSPEARATIENTANDRFAGQGDRAAAFVRSLTGGNADDVALQERLRNAAVRANKPAYKAAYEEGDQIRPTPELERIMSSPAVETAMKNAVRTGKDRAVKNGFGSFNPRVSIADDGRITFNRTNATGAPTSSDLQLFDYAKRELDDAASAAARAGRNGEADTLRGLSQSLRDELDKIVPSYKNARAGAAAFFGVEDALDAGRKFATTPMKIPEARRAFEKFTEPERAAFATGFASETIDKIKTVSDRTNVINRIFKSPAAREQFEMVFGSAGAKRMEAYVRAEDIVDRLRGSMGNSTTARQLVELGLGAGGGYAYSGDWEGALAGAAVARGARYAGQKVEANVMRRVADLLTSDSPDALRILANNAAMSPKYMQTLEVLGNAIAPIARGAAVTPGQ